MNLDSGREVEVVTKSSSTKAQQMALLEKLGFSSDMKIELRQFEIADADMPKVVAAFERGKLLRKDTTYENFTPLNDEASAKEILERTKRREA